MKVRSVVLTTIAVALLTGIASIARAQQGHTIRGKVRSSSGVNIAQITVGLESGNGGLINQTVTNNEGDFFFGGLSDTSYIIIISAPDYNPASERVEFVRNINPNDPGEIRTVEITLVTKDGVKPPRPGVKFVQNIPKAALGAFEQAKRFLANGRTQEAESSLQVAIKIFPSYFDARFMLANQLARQGDLDEAIKQLSEAQQINPKDDRVWYLFGTVLMQQGKHAIAARVFAEAANLSPADAEYRFMQGVALINQASLTEPTSAQANDARKYFLTEAEKVLLRAYEISGKKMAIVHLQLARLYEKQGDRARAAYELEQYLGQVPNVKNADAMREAIKRLRSPSERVPSKPPQK